MTTKRVVPEEAQRMVQDDGYVYLDVRSVPEFEAGHPMGAYCIPLMVATPNGMQPNPTFLGDVTKNFQTDTKLLIGCKSGVRSANAAAILEQSGFTAVVDVPGGYDVWAPAGLPTTKDGDGRGYADLSKEK